MTVRALAVTCAVGAAMWVGIILAALSLWRWLA